MLRKMANKFNTWYDGLGEPWKFLMALCLSVPALAIATGTTSMVILAFIYIFLLVAVRMEAAK